MNYPPNGHIPSQEPNGKEPPEPEVVILDATSHHEEGHHHEFEQLDSISQIHIAWKLRLVFLLLSAFCVVWFLGSVICWAFSSLFYLLTAYRYEPFNQWMWRFWKGMIRSFVFTIGMLVAALSPPLGLGFIMLYFVLNEDEAPMAQMFRANLQKFRD